MLEASLVALHNTVVVSENIASFNQHGIVYFALTSKILLDSEI